MSKAIFVLSLPRSGSSAVAGALHRMGVDMGEGCWQPKDASNPKGYYEDRRWVYVLKQLSGQNYNNHQVHRLPERYREQFRDLFEICSRKPLWGVKSPDIAFTFPHIWPISVGFCSMRVVHVRRDRQEVIDSIKRHSEVAYGGSRLLSYLKAERLIRRWGMAIERSLSSFAGPSYQVDYAELIDEPEPVLRGLAGFVFGRTKPNIEEAVRWIDPTMCHFSAS